MKNILTYYVPSFFIEYSMQTDRSGGLKHLFVFSLTKLRLQFLFESATDYPTKIHLLTNESPENIESFFNLVHNSLDKTYKITF